MCYLRWAAKEAAIKAHRHRHLYPHDISIVTTSGAKPIAFVPPQCPRICMNAEVATLRGIRGAVGNTSSTSEDAQSEVSQGNLGRMDGVLGKTFFERSMLYREEDQQVAELSLSHDGDYAVAVCMALDELSNTDYTQSFITDDGSGDPIHEPEWGDRGFLDALDYDELKK